MRTAALGLCLVGLVLAACTRKAPSEADAAAAPATATSAGAAQPPAWLAVAARTPIYGEHARQRRMGDGRKPPRLGEIDSLFDAIAALPATAAGIREGARRLEEGRALAADPKWAGSGASPGSALLHAAGMALLVDLTQRACKAHRGDAAIGEAADTAPLPSTFNSRGVAKDAAEEDRHLMREAARACGAKPD
jgi:hypothetical protein